MVTNASLLSERVEVLFNTRFIQRTGRVVPTSSDVTLKDGAVKVEAAFLYTDLAGSATLSRVCPWTTTAKIIRAFLDASTRLIIKHGGHVRSFDGDRVMGVFLGDLKNSSASICGREIHWTVRKIIHPTAAKQFASIRGNNIQIRNCSGIDVGDVRAARSGIRDNNDLIWIGKAASFSALLSEMRAVGYSTYISSRTYNRLNKNAKNNTEGNNIWEPSVSTFAGERETVYRTNHWKKP